MAQVLLFTHSADFDVPERVIAAVARRGATARRVDTDRYPGELRMALAHPTSGPAVLSLDGTLQTDLSAVYVRKLGAPKIDDLPAEQRAWLAREVSAHWEALPDLLPDLRWINPPRTDAATEGHKLRQLRLARAAGLRTPATLVTNDPDAVRTFYRAHRGDIVAKLLTALSLSMDGQSAQVRTNRLGEDDLDHLDGLSSGPMCFQERIVAERELRVMWVDGQAFVGAIDGHPDEVDWRQGHHGGFTRGELDADTHAALARLMSALGLTVGAIDLMVPAQGPPVFLEVNPGGEWGMLEVRLGLPIADALAAALLETR